MSGLNVVRDRVKGKEYKQRRMDNQRIEERRGQKLEGAARGDDKGGEGC